MAPAGEKKKPGREEVSSQPRKCDNGLRLSFLDRNEPPLAETGQETIRFQLVHDFLRFRGEAVGKFEHDVDLPLVAGVHVSLGEAVQRGVHRGPSRNVD